MAESSSRVQVPHLTRFPYSILSEQKVSAVVVPTLILDDTHQVEWPPESPQAAKNFETGFNTFGEMLTTSHLHMPLQK